MIEGTEKQVYGLDPVRMQRPRVALRADDDSSGRFGESLEHGCLPSLSAVLLMDCLPADSERVGDCLPGPTVASCTANLSVFQSLEQAAKGSYRAQPLPRIGTGGCGGKRSGFGHVVNIS